MMTRPICTAGLLAILALACVGASQPQQEDTQDTVTLQAAMESVGTADVELFGHSVARAAPGIPPFDPDLPADVWEEVESGVRQHVIWHTDDQFTVHAYPTASSGSPAART